MKVFHWPGGPPPAFPESVATLGVFDGVHIGHQAILRLVLAEASARGVPSVVITFDRHPHDVLGQPPQPSLTSLAHRLRLFEGLGVGACLVLGFSSEVAGMEAEEFARTVLRDMLGVRVLIGGPDCRFGAGGRGDLVMLRGMEDELGLEARALGPVEVDGEVVSSTAVRQAIRRADLRRAEKLLGRAFSLLGTVVRGAGRGREMGFPTANLDVHNELIPGEGVYATVLLTSEGESPSVTSMGMQETFQGEAGEAAVVEVHAIGLELDLYGRDVEVQFVARLREQRRFESAEALARQMALDVVAAREALSLRGV
jgi:riboflavin kinase/FMN adenylyltransferase